LIATPNFSKKAALRDIPPKSKHAFESMHKQDLLALLKEILSSQAANPSWISIKKTETGKYELTIKGEYQVEIINTIIQGKGFTATETNRTLTIH